ncbi:hypothetical protein [Halocatena marina]
MLDRLDARLIEHNPKDVYNPHPVKYDIFRTYDNEGRLPNLGKFEYSAKWQDFPTGPGQYEQLRMRNGNRGGTKIEGHVHVANEHFKKVYISTTVAPTPSEIKAALNEGVNEEIMADVYQEIEYKTGDALDECLHEMWEEHPDAPMV